MSAPLKVAVVSSEIGTACGIAEHSRQLVDAVVAADREIAWAADPAWLDPAAFVQYAPEMDVVLLNYHRGLHSRWTPEAVRAYGFLPFVIVFHDTYETQPDRLPWDLLACENVYAMIVHEPCDLSTPSVDNPHRRDGRPYAEKVRYWRQPCPNPDGRGIYPLDVIDAWRPTLGTLGFDFPWKNYDLLAEVTADCGWDLRIVGQVHEQRRLELLAKNPRTQFDHFTPAQSRVIGVLSACDATAFLYTCGNSGTSGAIRAGITAGKPIIAAKNCRQFRDLYEGTPFGRDGVTFGIHWIDPTAKMLARALQAVIFNYDPALIAFAHQESWARHGAHYAALLRDAAGSVPRG